MTKLFKKSKQTKKQNKSIILSCYQIYFNFDESLSLLSDFSFSVAHRYSYICIFGDFLGKLKIIILVLGIS